MFKDYTLQTTKGRALKVLAVGAILWAAINGILALLMFNAYIGGYMFYFQGRDDMGMVKTLTIAFGLPLAGWGVWAVFFSPIWLLLHKFGFRTRLSLMLAGFALIFFVIFMGSTHFFTGTRNWAGNMNTARFMDIDPGWHGATLTARGWWLAVMKSASYGIMGAIVAYVIWRFAYRRPAPC